LEQILREARTMTEEQIKKKIALAKRTAELTPRELEYVYYLDPEQGYAIRRCQELSKDGRIRIQTDNSEHQQLPDYKIWLPKKCVTNVYISEGSYPGEIFDEPFVTQVLDVSEYSTTRVPEEQFTLKYTAAGTKVTDMTLPESKLAKGGVSYRIPANPDDLDRVVLEARELTRAGVERENSKNTLKIVLLAANVVAIAGLLVILVIRYRRKVIKS
jgi:hypothetical protein